MQWSPLLSHWGAHKQSPCQGNEGCCFHQIKTLVALSQGGGDTSLVCACCMIIPQTPEEKERGGEGGRGSICFRFFGAFLNSLFI